MTAQPRPDYIVKPMPDAIPTFEIAPLERAATDRAANSERFAGETAEQRGFRNDIGDNTFGVLGVLVLGAAVAMLASIAYAGFYAVTRLYAPLAHFLRANFVEISVAFACAFAATFGIALAVYLGRKLDARRPVSTGDEA